MSKRSTPVARYAVNFGLTGCYMPDSYAGPFVAYSRHGLASAIRYQFSLYDIPASKFKDVRIRRLWSFIREHGSSTAHFRIEHKGFSLRFEGMTEDEYALAEGEEA